MALLSNIADNADESGGCRALFACEIHDEFEALRLSALRIAEVAPREWRRPFEESTARYEARRASIEEAAAKDRPLLEREMERLRGGAGRAR